MALAVNFFVKPFRDVIESIKDLVPSVVLSFAEDGMDMQSMDINKVALIELFVPSSSFVNYQFPDEDDFQRASQNTDEIDNDRVNVALDLKSLSKILKCVKPDSECECSYDMNADYLNMVFKNDGEQFAFELKLITLESGMMNIPVRDNNVTMTLPSDLYQSFTKDIATLAEDVEISVCESDENDEVRILKFDFQSDMGNGSWQVKFIAGIELHSFESSVKQRFSIHYLQNFGKAVQNAGRADVAMKADEPIEIVCPLPKFAECKVMPEELAEELYPFGYLKFFLAPKVEE